MEAILEMLFRRGEHLIGRASGPLNFRLVVMPTVVTILAIRAGRRDAREGHRPFLWNLLTDPAHALRSAIGDIGRIFIVALVLDTTYQLVVLRWLYLGELLVVAVVCAVVPYVLVRGPITRLVRRLYRNSGGPAKGAGAP
jgi:hypothetical protein